MIIIKIGIIFAGQARISGIVDEKGFIYHHFGVISVPLKLNIK
jgi:hypothetical protein